MWKGVSSYSVPSTCDTYTTLFLCHQQNDHVLFIIFQAIIINIIQYIPTMHYHYSSFRVIWTRTHFFFRSFHVYWAPHVSEWMTYFSFFFLTYKRVCTHTHTRELGLHTNMKINAYGKQIWNLKNHFSTYLALMWVHGECILGKKKCPEKL